MSGSSRVTIWHNPSCGTSRNTLAVLREAGLEPEIVQYLKTPPSRAELAAAIAAAGITVRDAVRRKGALYTELGLDKPDLSDDALLDALVAHPALIERPFVFTGKGVRLCRPMERVREILP
ncbi:arsenate reductase (glutaredoxin) [Xanthobacter agilis]|jgi:arsenate reductase (glutaredoxin)|uniref:Arsenate reductase n=1 Tax=Xanthobacter agilis TaxID=47492 RepID=A0ABU0LF33_XANAG|nr:arsenate reductase (glutaredoxin) [Xanthobacter agilis]MDQ0505718.1 arsenate reductase [Xanthobacter agilis]